MNKDVDKIEEISEKEKMKKLCEENSVRKKRYE
jgi:uncharacterized protein YnzC (UPF0291/DUF896 family)